MSKYLNETGLGHLISKIKSAITSAIQALDVSSVGGSGKVITTISETDGKISATAVNLSDVTVGYSSRLENLVLLDSPMRPSGDSGYIYLGYMSVTANTSCELLVTSTFWGNQHNSADIISILGDYRTNSDPVIQVDVGRIMINQHNSSTARTFYYRKEDTGVASTLKLHLYVKCTGGTGYGTWRATMLGGRTDFVPVGEINQTKDSPTDWYEIGFCGRVNLATHALRDLDGDEIIGKYVSMTNTSLQKMIGDLRVEKTASNSNIGVSNGTVTHALSYNTNGWRGVYDSGTGDWIYQVGTTDKTDLGSIRFNGSAKAVHVEQTTANTNYYMTFINNGGDTEDGDYIRTSNSAAGRRIQYNPSTGTMTTGKTIAVLADSSDAETQIKVHKPGEADGGKRLNLYYSSSSRGIWDSVLNKNVLQITDAGAVLNGTVQWTNILGQPNLHVNFTGSTNGPTVLTPGQSFIALTAITGANTSTPNFVTTTYTLPGNCVVAFNYVGSDLNTIYCI